MAVGVVERLLEEEALLPLPRHTENLADDASLHNPLKRAERLSTGWFGVIMELEGVIVESTQEAHEQAWLRTAQEFGYPRPLGQLLRRIKNAPDEVVVSRVFNWTRNPKQAKAVAARKAELYEQALGGRLPAGMLEAAPFLATLKRYNVPVALSAPLSEAKVEEALARTSLRPYFDTLVTADDSGSAEAEFYLAYAAQRIQRPPARCVVVGESNSSVEAAHELGMKCIVVTGNQPVYNFVGADLVVRNLSQVSFMNMKKLFGAEDLVAGRTDADELLAMEPQLELDEFEDD